MNKRTELVFPSSIQNVGYSKGYRELIGEWSFWLLALLMLGGQGYAARTGLETHVVGGQAVDAAAYPWMVGMVRSDDPVAYRGFVSGATLIHPSWVLTAAHSIDGLAAEDIELLVGVDSLLMTGRVPRRRITSIVRHPKYHRESETVGFDLALLRLEEPVVGIPTLPVSSLQTLPRDGTRTRALGWGRTTNKGFLSTTLQSVDLPVVTKEKVDVPALYGRDLPVDVFLAGYPQGGNDTCDGDSGGPLLGRDSQTGDWHLLGVILGGARRGCAVEGAFGLYTSVAAHLAWIESVMVRSYQDWAWLHSVGDTAADPDGDQVANWDEYAQLSHPRNSRSRPRLISKLFVVDGIRYPAVGGVIRLGTVDLECKLMVSSDMANWRVVESLPQQDASMVPRTASRFSWRSPFPLLGAAPQFIRLLAGRRLSNLELGSEERPGKLDLASR